MAKGKKESRVNIILECTEARKIGQTPSRYVTTKNRKNVTGRLEVKKYNPHLKRHTVHKEVR
jgi:large subunit ribosomal protein L33